MDECQNFLTLPYRFEELLPEARGYGLALHLAHQHLGQLPRELHDALSANARTKVYFTCSPEDARALERHVAPQLSAYDLSHLGGYQAAVRLVAGGSELPACTIRTRPAPPAIPGRAEPARAAARDPVRPHRQPTPRRDATAGVRGRRRRAAAQPERPASRLGRGLKDRRHGGRTPHPAPPSPPSAAHGCASPQRTGPRRVVASSAADHASLAALVGSPHLPPHLPPPHDVATPAPAKLPPTAAVGRPISSATGVPVPPAGPAARIRRCCAGWRVWTAERPDRLRLVPRRPLVGKVTAAIGGPRAAERLAAVAGRVTDRDRRLCRLLAEHRVLTTHQLTQLAFTNRNTADHRLRILWRLGLVDRFRPHHTPGSAPYHYVLGPLGAALLAAHHDHDPIPALLGYRRDRTLALAHSQRLTHLIGVNSFFCALAQDARRQEGAELERWWSEQALRHPLGPPHPPRRLRPLARTPAPGRLLPGVRPRQRSPPPPGRQTHRLPPARRRQPASAPRCWCGCPPQPARPPSATPLPAPASRWPPPPPTPTTAPPGRCGCRSKPAAPGIGSSSCTAPGDHGHGGQRSRSAANPLAVDRQPPAPPPSTPPTERSRPGRPGSPGRPAPPAPP